MQRSLHPQYIKARERNTELARRHRARQAILLNRNVSKIDELEKEQIALKKERTSLQTCVKMLVHTIKMLANSF